MCQAQNSVRAFRGKSPHGHRGVPSSSIPATNRTCQRQARATSHLHVRLPSMDLLQEPSPRPPSANRFR
ncbi:hypothetical protein PVAP13_4KG114000 [Panicum virgatum]|uniref:Uncharacterized protein n=1 Tax=Panicum virgatum TaxID=38727 RepID=A0A8T0TNI9_PANVG|nr:hypothetical protein PVAP13_4KG114000 [Panicum virgatum]